MSKLGRGGRGPADGPHNSQGFQQDWALFSGEMSLSAMHGGNWKDVDILREYFKQHKQEHDEIKRRAWCIAPGELRRLFERIMLWWKNKGAKK
jgi:hypothetical protein